MFYPKNVPNIERVLRVILGAILIGVAVLIPPVIGYSSPLLQAVIVFSALFAVVTGFIGWCPACAMIGRKLTSQKRVSVNHRLGYQE